MRPHSLYLLYDTAKKMKTHTYTNSLSSFGTGPHYIAHFLSIPDASMGSTHSQTSTFKCEGLGSIPRTHTMEEKINSFDLHRHDMYI